MLCKDIIKIIEKQYGTTYACSWDNVGLLVGSDEKEVKKVYLALDATDEVIENAVSLGADMIVTHHPLIFSGMKRINNHDFIGRRILKLIQNDISYYAMHTNYDVRGMADLASDMLKLDHPVPLDVMIEEDGIAQGIGKVGALIEEMTLKQLCEKVKEVFSLENVKVFGALEQKVGRVAICPGSGKSDVDTAIEKGADVYITGDIDHHTGIDSVAKGLAIIDAGHYGIEHIFIEDMRTYLADELAGVEIVKAPIVHPFCVV